MGIKARLRALRYTLPYTIGTRLPVPDLNDARQTCRRSARRGLAATLGYFQGDEAHERIAQTDIDILGMFAAEGLDGYLSLKAPALGFDPALVERIALAARAAGRGIVFDAHGPDDADRTYDLIDKVMPVGAALGVVLPGRWRRSVDDAARFRDQPLRVRVVKGEWPDPSFPDVDGRAGYLDVVRQLAGRQATVAVATHDPGLAREALTILLAAGTPCELEQLHRLPRRATTRVARELGVPVRLYVPFGPGWIPYAIDKALGRPYLVSWMLKDALAGRF